MPKLIRHFVRTLSLVASFTISAAFAQSDLMIDSPYARATPPNAPASAVFFTAHNHSSMDIDIVSAATSAAKKVELHTVVMDGDVMQMRQVPTLTVPANKHLELKPGGYHVMLLELTQDFVEGDEITVELTLSNGEVLTVEAPIKKVMSGMKHHHH